MEKLNYTTQHFPLWSAVLMVGPLFVCVKVGSTPLGAWNVTVLTQELENKWGAAILIFSGRITSEITHHSNKAGLEGLVPSRTIVPQDYYME